VVQKKEKKKKEVPKESEETIKQRQIENILRAAEKEPAPKLPNMVRGVPEFLF
jgi:hypothetical protein